LKVLNPTLFSTPVLLSKHSSIVDLGALTFRDIDGVALQLPEENFPFKRILSWHAKCSVKWAVRNNWITQAMADENYVPYFNTSDGGVEPEEPTDLESLMS
jgi:hypothetical protein